MSYTYCYFIRDLRRLTLEQSRAEQRLPFAVAQCSLQDPRRNKNRPARGNRSRIGEPPFITERVLTKHTAGEVAHYRAFAHTRTLKMHTRTRRSTCPSLFGPLGSLQGNDRVRTDGMNEGTTSREITAGINLRPSGQRRKRLWRKRTKEPDARLSLLPHVGQWD